MYKLTFYDNRLSPVCDGVVSYYVDDLNEFENHWLREPAVSVDRINRYFKSKFGILTTDYWNTDNDEELDIVQEDDSSEIISEISYQYTNRTITTRNAYVEGNKYHFDKLTIDIRKVKYKNEYILLAKYFAEGVAEKGDIYNARLGKHYKYTSLSYYGNPIAHYDTDIVSYANSNDKTPYKNSSLKSFAWTEIEKQDNGKKLPKNFRLNKDQIAYLFWDIPGEAG